MPHYFARPHDGQAGPGLQYQRMGDIHVLVKYDDAGALRGILAFYEHDVGDFKAGTFHVSVHPDHRRRGIGLQLLAEAYRRWDIKVDPDHCTPEGLALREAYRRSNAG